jgi:bacterioferritin-associated ferredoxin
MSPKEIKDCKGVIKACAKCKKAMHEYKSRLRDRALEAGKCEYCRVRKALPGHTGCGRCISATHRRRNLVGLCICGKEPVRFKGASLGENCLKRQKAYMRKKTTV